VLVYSRIDHPRLRYAMQRAFEGLSETTIITASQEEFNAHEGAKLWYDSEPCLLSVAAIIPVNVLWNDDVQTLHPGILYWNSIPFPDLDGSGRFDPLASIFFLLSRYEEYTADALDEHGRFSGHSAWGGVGIIARPVVDLWRVALLDMVREHHAELNLEMPPYRIVATIDVDSAFAFRYKGIRRTAGAVLRNVVMGKWRQAFERAHCVLTDAHDPFDTYDFIIDYCNQHRIELRTFFLLANRSRFDINVDHRNEQLQDRMHDIQDTGAIVGIHPGYQSHDNIEILQEEIQRLSHILEEKVIHSRQHFLKFRLPESYQRLMACGIQHDHSMGYADVPGFRAGTCRAFPWFDLQHNRETTLMIHPVVVMDSTLNSYMHLSPDDAMVTIDGLRREVQGVGGDFTSLWHNETVAERGIWKGWRAVWQHALR
jgi:hypothetical protein